MKQLKRIFMFVALFIVLITATACSNKGVKNISCDLSVTAKRDKVTVVASFIDQEKRIFNTITPTVAIYKKGEKEQISTKNLTMKNGSDLSKPVSDEAVFNNLLEEQEYVVKVLVTVDGYQSTLAEKETKTTLEGSDADHPSLIKTVDDFLAIKHDKDGFFKLENDLDFNNITIEPMYSLSTSAFKGEFDGNNHKISNLKIESNSHQYVGLFGYNSGTIKDLTIDNLSITAKKGSEAHIGLVAGMNEGKILNVNVTNSNLTAESTTYSALNKFSVGGLVGTLSGNKENICLENSTLTGSKVNAKLVNSGHVGAAVGSIENSGSARFNQSISNVKVEASLNVEQALKTNSSKNINIFVGGFVGEASGNITDSVAKVDLTLTTKSVDSFYSTIEENQKNEILEFNVYVGGFSGRNIPNSYSFFNNILFDGSISVNSELNYTESASDKKPKHLTFNLYAGGLFGENTDVILTSAISRVSKFDVTTTKKFINGEHNIYVGKSFGKTLMSLDKLTSKNIYLYQDYTQNVVNNDFKLNSNEIYKIDNSLVGFSDIIKDSLK